MPSWHLDDPRPIAEENKYTFWLPSPEVIASVSVGESVKLIFCFESRDPNAPRAERMWVRVETIDGRGGFSGRLNSDPQFIADIKDGDPVDFQSHHIIATEYVETDDVFDRYRPRCLVTRRVLSEGAKIRYLCRVWPEAADDSGWRISDGDASQEYIGDLRNLACVALGAVLNHDDSFVHLLDLPPGAAFERGEVDDVFVAVRNVN